MDVKARVEFHLQLRFARYSRMFLQLGYSILEIMRRISTRLLQIHFVSPSAA